MTNNPLLLFHKGSVYISQFLPLSGGVPLGDTGKIFARSRPRGVREGEMIAIAGRTGTGKTFFKKAFIGTLVRYEPWLNRYHLDSKKQGDFTSRDGPIIRSLEPPPPLTGKGQVQIWQPEQDDKERYSRYFKGILDAGIPAIVDVDEAKNISFNGDAPRGYELLVSQGRLPGIHVISATQEVARSPRQMWSQSKHLISFRLYNAYDFNMIKRYMRLYHVKELPISKKHGFVYLDTDAMGTPKIYDDVRDFLNEFFRPTKRG